MTVYPAGKMPQAPATSIEIYGKTLRLFEPIRGVAARTRKIKGGKAVDEQGTAVEEREAIKGQGDWGECIHSPKDCPWGSFVSQWL